MNFIKNNEQFESEVINSDKPVLVGFYADWCGPCQEFAPVFESVSKKAGKLVKSVKINVDDCGDIANDNSIESIPSMLIYKNGEVLSHMGNAAPEEDVLNWILETFTE